MQGTVNCEFDVTSRMTLFIRCSFTSQLIQLALSIFPCTQSLQCCSTFSVLQISSTVTLANTNDANTPNILFVIADDLATRVNCYGDPAAITPNIDRLAAEGEVFERAYVQGTVCTPSRTAFMLGLNNRSAKRNHFVQNPDTLTMGRFFRSNGYQTFSVGKIDHTEHFIDPEAWDIRARVEFNPAATKLTPIREESDRKRLAFRHGVADRVDDCHDWLIANEAIRFLESRRETSKPFFAAVGFHKPHQPAISTHRHFDAHADVAKFVLHSTPADASPIATGYLRDEPGFDLAEAQQRLACRSYYASVSLMDEQLGRILDVLEDAELARNTLVLFTSDHGYHLGWRGQWAKHDLSEEVMRVPLIVRWPGVTEPGSRSFGIVELIDLFPTFAEVARLPIPESLDGKSFIAQLRDPESPGKRAAYCDDGRKGRTVRTPNWRLTQRPGGNHELYHLPSDPSEYYNLFDDPDKQKVVERLSHWLDTELGPFIVLRKSGRTK